MSSSRISSASDEIESVSESPSAFLDVFLDEDDVPVMALRMRTMTTPAATASMGILSSRFFSAPGSASAHPLANAIEISARSIACWTPCSRSGWTSVLATEIMDIIAAMMARAYVRVSCVSMRDARCGRRVGHPRCLKTRTTAAPCCHESRKSRNGCSPRFAWSPPRRNGGTSTHSKRHRIGHDRSARTTRDGPEAVEPAQAASPAAKPAAPVTGAPAQNENAYSEIQRRAKAGSFCFGTDDDVKPTALPVPKPPVEPVDDSIARVDPGTLDLKDLRTACASAASSSGAAKMRWSSDSSQPSPRVRARRCRRSATRSATSRASNPDRGSKRSSPCAAAAAADDDDDDGAPVARKIARTQHAGNAIFADGDKQTRDPSWAPKADAFLGEMLSSPAKTVTVSEAKLRDLGVGRDVFSDVASPSAASRKGARERSVSGLRGCDIFADDVETAKERGQRRNRKRRGPRRRRPRAATSSRTRPPEAAKDETKKKATGLGKVFTGGVAREFVSSVTFGDEDAAMNTRNFSRNANFGHKPSPTR